MIEAFEILTQEMLDTAQKIQDAIAARDKMITVIDQHQEYYHKLHGRMKWGFKSGVYLTSLGYVVVSRNGNVEFYPEEKMT